MQIAYIFFYTIADPYNFNTLGVLKKPVPVDHEFSFLLYLFYISLPNNNKSREVSFILYHHNPNKLNNST